MTGALPEYADARLLIGGELVATPTHMPVEDPSLAEAFAAAPVADAALLDQAVAAAAQAQPGWAETSLDQRRSVLRQIARRLAENEAQLAHLLTLEQGKPLAQAAQEIRSSVNWLQGTASLPLEATLNEIGEDQVSLTQHLPLGVVAGIAPWNYPLLLAVFKLAPALLAGNAIVLKPSPFTPLTTLALGRLIRDLVPPGVVGILSGDDALGPLLTAHPGFAKISFTGSTATGKRIMAAAAHDLKRVTLELGGNDAAIVLADADLDLVAAAMIRGAFGNCGQVCLATKRLYVARPVHRALVERLVAALAKVRIGRGTEPGVEIGPLNNRQQFDRVSALVADCRANGHQFAYVAPAVPERGYFIAPSLVDAPPEASRIVVEEQFGPILPILPFDVLDHVIEQVNCSPFGLGASVWSRDLAGARSLAMQLQCGNVFLNRPRHLSPLSPFGGMRQSGLGVEGGVAGLLAYTQTRTIVL